MAKEKFIIEPHFRLQEWVAEEKGYFKDEGLDYEFRELVQSSDGASQQLGDKIGAMQTFERGRKSDVSCACHWTVNVAASKGHGKMYADAYSVSPAAVFVPPESPIRVPEDGCWVHVVDLEGLVGRVECSRVRIARARRSFLRRLAGTADQRPAG